MVNLIRLFGWFCSRECLFGRILYRVYLAAVVDQSARPAPPGRFCLGPSDHDVSLLSTHALGLVLHPRSSNIPYSSSGSNQLTSSRHSSERSSSADVTSPDFNSSRQRTRPFDSISTNSPFANRSDFGGLSTSSPTVRAKGQILWLIVVSPSPGSEVDGGDRRSGIPRTAGVRLGTARVVSDEDRR